MGVLGMGDRNISGFYFDDEWARSGHGCGPSCACPAAGCMGPCSQPCTHALRLRSSNHQRHLRGATCCPRASLC
jgi:hypothetical protein